MENWQSGNTGIHLGSKSDYDDIDELIERNACAKEYYKLEDCLAEYDRDWTKCQVIVKALKACNDKQKTRK